MGKAPAKSEYGSGSSQRREGDMRQLSTLLETLPPHAIEAEMSLLGSILIDPNIIADVIHITLHLGIRFHFHVRFCL